MTYRPLFQNLNLASLRSLTRSRLLHSPQPNGGDTELPTSSASEGRARHWARGGSGDTDVELLDTVATQSSNHGVDLEKNTSFPAATSQISESPGRSHFN